MRVELAPGIRSAVNSPAGAAPQFGDDGDPNSAFIFEGISILYSGADFFVHIHSRPPRPPGQ